jgi:hypothetical protein
VPKTAIEKESSVVEFILVSKTKKDCPADKYRGSSSSIDFLFYTRSHINTEKMPAR